MRYMKTMPTINVAQTDQLLAAHAANTAQFRRNKKEKNSFNTLSSCPILLLFRIPPNHLTHSPVHTMRHGPLVLVRLVRFCAQASLRAFCGVLVLERLPDFEVDLVAVHDVLGHGEDV